MDENSSEALNNLISSIKEKMGESNTSNMNLSNILNNTQGTGNDTIKNDEEAHSNSDSSASFDPQLFLKIQKIMSAMNGDNPKKNLLLSLKPFLRKTRQDKINEYITILNIISALDSFKKGSE